jgi:hypothetical protein
MASMAQKWANSEVRKSMLANIIQKKLGITTEQAHIIVKALSEKKSWQ